MPREAYFTLSAIASAKRLQAMNQEPIDSILGVPDAREVFSELELAEKMFKAFGLPDPDQEPIDVVIRHSLTDTEPVLQFTTHPPER